MSTRFEETHRSASVFFVLSICICFFGSFIFLFCLWNFANLVGFWFFGSLWFVWVFEWCLCLVVVHVPLFLVNKLSFFL